LYAGLGSSRDLVSNSQTPSLTQLFCVGQALALRGSQVDHQV